jgi:hypothetical protein
MREESRSMVLDLLFRQLRTDNGQLLFSSAMPKTQATSDENGLQLEGFARQTPQKTGRFRSSA